jgi:hypothetical protein
MLAQQTTDPFTASKGFSQAHLATQPSPNTRCAPPVAVKPSPLLSALLQPGPAVSCEVDPLAQNPAPALLQAVQSAPAVNLPLLSAQKPCPPLSSALHPGPVFRTDPAPDALNPAPPLRTEAQVLPHSSMPPPSAVKPCLSLWLALQSEPVVSWDLLPKARKPAPLLLLAVQRDAVSTPPSRAANPCPRQPSTLQSCAAAELPGPVMLSPSPGCCCEGALLESSCTTVCYKHCICAASHPGCCMNTALDK